VTGISTGIVLQKSFQCLTFIVRFVESVVEKRNTTIDMVLANWADPVYKGRCRASYSNFQKLCGQIKQGEEGGIEALDLVVRRTEQAEQDDENERAEV